MTCHATEFETTYGCVLQCGVYAVYVNVCVHMCECVCMITCIHVILFKIYYLCPLTVCSQNIYWNNAAQHSVWVTFFLHRKVFVWVCVFVCSVQLSNIRLPFYNFVLFGTIFYILLYFLIFLIVIILFIFQYVTIFIIFLKFFLFACSYYIASFVRVCGISIIFVRI